MAEKIYRYDCPTEEWKKFIEAMNSKQTLQIDEEMYFYWLEVLPPAYMDKLKQIDVSDNGNIENVRCSFGFAEGFDYITDFWKKDGKYFCKRSNELKTWD